VETTRFSNVFDLIEYESDEIRFLNTFLIIEASIPGDTYFHNTFLLIEVPGEPSGVDIYSVQMKEGDPDKMGEPLFGDRSAWDTDKMPDHHARDIDEASPQYHVDPGDEIGKVPVWDGTKWTAQFQPAGSISIRQDGIPQGVADTFNLVGLDATVAGSTASIKVSQPLVHYIGKNFPYHGAPATLTPSAHGATSVRVFPFTLIYSGVWDNLYLRTNAAVATCLNVGIYSSAGARLWQSTGLSTIATGYITIAMGGLTLPAGTYYFATANNGSTSTTAAFTVSLAMGATGGPPPKYGVVTTAGGALPASFNPITDIAANNGGYMIFGMMQR
jgi:hypothetical protein